MSYKPTKEEIALCKKIAEKHRKEIEYGDWYANNGVILLNNNFLVGTIHVAKQIRLGFILLWRISDCLEFMGGNFRKLRICNDEILEVEYLRRNGTRYELGRTPLEALLKAVLAILEEKK